jgi:hypothetical protein
MRFCSVIAVTALCTGLFTAHAEDPGTELNDLLAQKTGERLRLIFEFRTRFETRSENNFGRSADLDNPLFRTRIGADFRATKWLKLSATGQDSRAPLYGGPAPNSARDTMDLHEGYAEFFPDQKGFGAVVGRQAVTLGEGRLIGIPQWRNTARSYDTARVYHRSEFARLEFLLVSLVNVRPDHFNKPRLGDRLWGTYSTFFRLIPKSTVDLYILRRDQNRPGGFTLPGTLGINTFGGRAAGALPWSLRYSTEVALQNGKNGLKQHRGFAAFGNVGRSFGLLSVSAEYKYASGDRGDNPARETTFDQLYAANHDRFGHADLFGWRNIHNLRSLETVQVTKRFAVNFMYDNWWLVSATDALYDGSGKPIVVSTKGVAGRHVGQEFDLFGTFQASRGLQLGTGVAHVLAGEFLKKTMPRPDTTYFYVFQSYTF